MAGLCFYYEDNDIDVYSGRPCDLDAWNYALQAGGPDMRQMMVLNRTNQMLHTPNAKVSFEVRSETEGELVELSGKVAYFVPPSDGRATEDLWDFHHEVDWYFFGPAQRFYFEPKSQDSVVAIPIPVQLHALHVASIVMAHRYAVKHKE